MAASIHDIVAAMQTNANGTRFTEACKVAEHFFGAPRSVGSHTIYRTPWPGDPRINLQKDGAKAKGYQVRQLLAAIEKLGALPPAPAQGRKARKDPP